MHPVVLDVLAVQAALITEILLKLLVHIVSDGLPTRGGRREKEASLVLRAACQVVALGGRDPVPHHSELFTASPKPGVSTMVSFNLTPFSSMSTVCFRISTVWLMRSAEGGEGVFAGHRHLFSGQQGRPVLTHPGALASVCLTVYSGPLLIPSQGPLPQAECGCPLRFLRVGEGEWISDFMKTTHPQHSAVSGPYTGRSERGYGQGWTSPGRTHLAIGTVKELD